MKAIHLLTTLLITATVTTAQVPGVDWVNKVVGSDSKTLGSDPQGNLYTIGFTGLGTFVDVDPGPGTHIAYGDSGTVLIYKFTSAGQFVWVKQLPFGVTAECVRADASQNAYVIGTYGLTKDFDPGPAVFNLTGMGQNDVFILKLDMNGNFVWAKSYGGTQMDVGLSLTVSDNGTIYSTGYFNGTSDFDPGPGVFNLTSGILSDCFIAALDAGGNFLWARHISEGFNQGHSITTNSLGDLIIGGVFSGTKDLDPTGGVFSATAVGAGDIFILKLNSAGGFVWVKTLGSPGSEQDESVALDPIGNVYVTGSFKLTADMDTGPTVQEFTAAGPTDIFVLKLAADGTFLWAKQLGGPLADIPKAIAADAAGNVYTTGLFQDVADFDPGAGVHNLTTNGFNDIFISKLNSDGSFGWATGFGAETSEDKGDGVALDATGNVYLAGTFQGQVDFDPGPGAINLLNSTQSNFLMKFGASGGPLPLTLLNFSGSNSSKGNTLQWQTSQEINTASFQVQWCSDGRQFSTIATITAAGNSTTTRPYNYLHGQPAAGTNYYRLKMIDRNGHFTYSPVVKIDCTATAPNITVYPNPVTDILYMNIQAVKNEMLVLNLLNSDGKVLLSRSFAVQKGGNTVSWKMAALAAGNYFISCSNQNYQPINIVKQ